MFDFFGKIHGVKPEKLKERKEELFTYFGIKDFAHKKMKEAVNRNGAEGCNRSQPGT